MEEEVKPRKVRAHEEDMEAGTVETVPALAHLDYLPNTLLSIPCKEFDLECLPIDSHTTGPRISVGSA